MALKKVEVEIKIDPPSSVPEIELANIWAELLNVEIAKIGRHTSFFEMGGDSISAIQLVSMIEKRGWTLPVNQIFKKPLLSQVALLLVDAKLETYGEIIVE
jgi:arthrofactin-type cyclic lipopeptide synthetase C